MVKRILKICCFFILTHSCSEHRNSWDNIDYCENQLELFSVHDTVPNFKIDYSAKPASIFDFIEKQINISLCWNDENFGLKLKNEVIVNVHLFRPCNDGYYVNFGKFPEVNILLNQDGIVELNHEAYPMDSIAIWIGENYPNNSDSDLEDIIVAWYESTPPDSIEKALNNILNGYLLSYQRLAIERFKKGICDLDERELDSVKNLLPFSVQLGIGNVYKPGEYEIFGE